MGWNDVRYSMRGDNHQSVGTRVGLRFDPLHYIADAFGFQDNYDAFVNKSGDFLNKQASSVVKPVDAVHRQYDPLHKYITSTPQGDAAAKWIANKPATTAGIVYGGIAGGQAAGGLLGGGGGGSGAGAGGAGVGTEAGGYGAMGGLQSGGGLGVFANGGAGGMANVGVGNAGVLANSGLIGGGAGIGGAGAGGSAMTWQDYAQLAQKAAGSQQQQQQPAYAPAPTNNRSALIAQRDRQERAQKLRKKLHRTLEENEELRELSGSGLLEY